MTTQPISTTRSNFRYHMQRMWPRRHDSASSRASVRDNIRAQRNARATERRVDPATIRWMS